MSDHILTASAKCDHLDHPRPQPDQGDQAVSATTTAQVDFGKCPACRNPINAHMTYAATLGDPSFGNEVVTATLRPIGVTIRHECKDGRPVAHHRARNGTA